MRLFLFVAVSLFALCRAWRDRRFRYYCLTFILSTVVVEGYLLSGGSPYDDTYSRLYFWAVFATTAVACWIGHRTKPRPPAALGCMSFMGAAIANQPEQIMLLQAAWLSIPAWQCWHTPLGKLWAAQSALFFAYALGVQRSPLWWYWVGEWLPATLVIAAFMEIAIEPNQT